MGQSQSSHNDGSADTEEPLKRDYYDLLSIERIATDEEIKKAYRRKALELHPDRNYGNEEGATRLFAEIQAAYEVLSDPQERAWYDSHRDVLLRGDTVAGDGGISGGNNFAYGSKMTSAEEVLKLMMKFNSRVQFSDAPTGFYGGLQEFFEILAKEEDIAAQWDNQDSLEYPPFGSQHDDYEDIVRPFYAAWNGFATKKSYAWKDRWRLSDAPDRRIRRLMEKENKKIRDEAIFEFNDAVRSLVAFVRKRDLRVQKNQKSETERQRALKELAAAQAARSRASREAELESFSLPQWARSREQEKNEFEGTFSSEEEEERHEYECVVCDKVFKSDKQFEAHEKSKKHNKLLKELKHDMKKENQDLNLEQSDRVDKMATAGTEQMQDCHKDTVDKKVTAESADDSDDEIDYDSIAKPANTDVQPRSQSSSASESEDNSDYAPRAEVEQRLVDDYSDSDRDRLTTLASDLKASTILQSGANTPLSGTSDPDFEPTSQPRLGKAKQKRAKKAAAAAVVATTDNAKPGSNSGSSFQCAVCQAEFSSKTKMFSHIKEKDHAALQSEVKGSSKGGSGRRKKK